MTLPDYPGIQRRTVEVLLRFDPVAFEKRVQERLNPPAERRPNPDED